MLTQRFDTAFAFAHDHHRQQVRKGSNLPYITHLMGVANLVIEHGGNEDQAIATLLHDAVEDGGGPPMLERIRADFGNAVADIVSDCTDYDEEPRPPWRQRKEAYLATLPTKSKSSLLVSLADKTHNAESIGNDYKQVGEEVWDRFSADKEGVLWYYGELVKVFEEAMPGVLTERLKRAVSGF